MINKLKSLFTPSFKLSIYMKSGNVINISNVTDWKLKHEGDTITSLTLDQKFNGSRLIVGSINLSQIEAIVRHY